MTKPGVLFDVDGTLCDTNYLHAIAWSRALLDAGEYAPTSTLHHHIGMGSDKFLQAVLGHDNEDAVKAHSDHFRKLHQEVRAFPDAAKLLRAINSRGIRVVLASSADPDELKVLRKAIAADDVIDDATNAGEVEASKPDPDIFRTALSKSNLDAANCIVVGDTVWDVQAAAEADMKCIGVLTGGISKQQLFEAGAVAVYDDVSDLHRNLDTSAIAKLMQ